MIREIKFGSKKVAGLTMSASDQIPIDPKPDRRTGLTIDMRSFGNQVSICSVKLGHSS
jgi:hypothetical protein